MFGLEYMYRVQTHTHTHIDSIHIERTKKIKQTHINKNIRILDENSPNLHQPNELLTLL